ncbi:MAG: hypothetical protein M3144_09580 [Actinomycetota bacterium]|nr:hypothetical protein [Actinomycetota bacterium]
MLLGIVTIPAVVNVGFSYVTRNRLVNAVELISYREYVGVSSALLVFVALTAPDIVCPDRRQRVLVLLFARPLAGVDYVVAKIGAIFSILFAFSFLPQVLLFVGQALVSDRALEYVGDNLEVLWKVPLSVSLLALFYAVVGVAIASLASRRIVAGASFIGFFLVSSITSGILAGGPDETGSTAALVNVLGLPLYLRDLVFLGQIDPASPLGGVRNGGLYAVAAYGMVAAVAGAVLVYRYRWTER